MNDSASNAAGKPTHAKQLANAIQQRWQVLVVVICQATTVWLTWPLWQVRETPPNLPIAESLPSVSMGIPMLVTLVIAIRWPRVGAASHWLVLVLACAMDQFRVSPQFFGLAVLLLAGTGNLGRRFCRLHLASMWTWAGLHKLFSVDWTGHASWSLVSRTGLDPEGIHLQAAYVVAFTELALGLMALITPRIASWLCVAIHGGIVLFLSPLVADMNQSVIAWNVAIVVIGFWVLQNSKSILSRPQQTGEGGEATSWREFSLLALMLTLPLGFYGGWVDRCFCHVLYSDNLPRGMISTKSGAKQVRGWGDLEVPFPSERRNYISYFARVANEGDKLHVYDPRPSLPDLFFEFRNSQAVAISEDEFLMFNDKEILGVALDRRRSIFELTRAGATLVREGKQAMVYAAVIEPDRYDPELLDALNGLKNLTQVDLSGTKVTDDDLAKLVNNRMLLGIGLNHTDITDAGLQALDDLPYLNYVEAEGTSIKSPLRSVD